MLRLCWPTVRNASPALGQWIVFVEIQVLDRDHADNNTSANTRR